MTDPAVDTRERLEKAALEMFRERGFDATSAADVAAKVGVTERTFFRYFPDKRDVLFGGGTLLQDFLAQRIGETPELAPLDAVSDALETAAEFLEHRRPLAKMRRDVIAAHPELQERERTKLASIATAIAGALQARGVPQVNATLVGELGSTIFKVGFDHWLLDEKKKSLAHHLRATRKALQAVAMPASARAERRRKTA